MSSFETRLKTTFCENFCEKKSEIKRTLSVGGIELVCRKKHVGTPGNPLVESHNTFPQPWSKLSAAGNN